MSVSPPPVGLLPAAGRGLRFGGSAYAKELFPLLFEDAPGADLEPRPICELALRAIRSTGAERCVAVVSREKAELVRVLGAGRSVEMSLAYVVQSEPRGLPDVVRCARPWLAASDVVFAMPDTVFFPGTALAEVHAHRIASGHDVVLGVFPVDEPERLGPVALSEAGAVTRIYDKPGETPHRNTWGVASWTARFTDFCVDWAARVEAGRPESQSAPELALGHAFEAARIAGLSVGAVPFRTGGFLDIGTPRGLRAALAMLAERGVLVADQAARATRAVEPPR